MTNPYPKEIAELAEFQKNNPNYRRGNQGDHSGENKSTNQTSYYSKSSSKVRLERITANEILLDDTIDSLSYLPFLGMDC